MNKEERKKYVFAQLRSLPNAFQYVAVTDYVNSLENKNTNLKQALYVVNIAITENKRKDGQLYLNEWQVWDILQIITEALGDEK